MTIKGHYVLTYGGQLAAIWGQSRAFRVAAIMLAVALVFMLVCEALYLAFDSEESMLEPIGYLSLVVLLWVGLIWHGVRRASQQQRDVTYLIDDERIVLRDAAGNEMSSPWREVTALEESRYGFLIRLGGAARWLARAGFAPDALADFRALARAELGDKARLLA